MGGDDFVPFEGIDAFVEEDSVENEVSGAINYAFIGAGGAGNRIAEQFYQLGYKKTVVINTAEQDLASIAIPDDQKLTLDVGFSGAGKDMVKGEQAFEKKRAQVLELIKRVFGENFAEKPHHVMICIGAGGGTGGGSAIPLILTVKDYLRYIGSDDLDKKVGVILSLPTKAEASSKRVAYNAVSLAEKLSGMAEDPTPSISPLLLIDNDRISKMYRGLTVRQYYPQINRDVASLFHLFNDICLKAGDPLSFDPEDYQSIITAGGHAIFGVSNLKEATSAEDISKAIFDNLDRTLLATGFDLTTAKVGGSVLIGSDRMFDEVEGLMDAAERGFGLLSSMTKSTVHRGMYTDARDTLRVYTLLGGLSRPRDRYRQLRTLAGEGYPSMKS